MRFFGPLRFFSTNLERILKYEHGIDTDMKETSLLFTHAVFSPYPFTDMDMDTGQGQGHENGHRHEHGFKDG
jgi:hypothetical protein